MKVLWRFVSVAPSNATPPSQHSIPNGDGVGIRQGNGGNEKIQLERSFHLHQRNVIRPYTPELCRISKNCNYVWIIKKEKKNLTLCIVDEQTPCSPTSPVPSPRSFSICTCQRVFEILPYVVTEFCNGQLSISIPLLLNYRRKCASLEFFSLDRPTAPTPAKGVSLSARPSLRRSSLVSAPT